jgi:hypothetical protein
VSRYIDGELIRVEAGREGSPVCHIVWDANAQRECRTYPTAQPALTDEQVNEIAEHLNKESYDLKNPDHWGELIADIGNIIRATLAAAPEQS